MTSVVYFLRSESGKIKIGVSRRLKQRLQAYRTSAFERIELLGCISGNQSVEKRIHMELCSYRMNGEWFFPSDEVIKKINDLLSAGATQCVQSSSPPDEYTKAAAKWADEAVAMLKWHGYPSSTEAKRYFAKICSLQPGTIENLFRGRMAAISATDYEAVRNGLILVANAEVSRLRAECELAESFSEGENLAGDGPPFPGSPDDLLRTAKS